MAHVVVVEDEHEIQALIISALREEGHTVESFADGREALDRLTGPGMTQPDLIVLDLMLPNVDGLAITREVRRTRITPILMLTAKSTELDRVLGLELGADDYLTKPFSIRELQARVGAILRRVEMMRGPVARRGRHRAARSSTATCGSTRPGARCWSTAPRSR